MQVCGCAEAAQEAYRPQKRHSRLIGEHHDPLFAQAPQGTAIQDKSKHLQSPRAFSGPEKAQKDQPQGLIRQIPPPDGQFPNPELRYPQPRLTSSTEALEQIHPGSTRRGDFHSDPTTQSTMDNYRLRDVNYTIAIPSQGLPGPFSYGSFPRVSLSERRRNFNFNQPRGKKNPIKRSSDDARRSSSGAEGKRQTLGHRRPSQFDPLQLVHSPEPMQVSGPSPHTFLHPIAQPYSTEGGPFWGGAQQRSLPHGPVQSTQHPVLHSSYDNNKVIPSGTTYSQPASHVVSTPLSQTNPPTRKNSFSHPPSHSSELPNLIQERTATIEPQNLAGSMPNSLNQVQVPGAQPQGPNRLTRTVPTTPTVGASFIDDRRPHPQNYEHPLPSISDEHRASSQQTPRHLKHQGREQRKGCRIWVGGFPSDFDKGTAKELLRPCQGLLDVTELRVTENSPRLKKYLFAKYVSLRSLLENQHTNPCCCSFRSQHDAEEALYHIPRTRFTILEDGAHLSANWPYNSDTPFDRDQQKGKANTRQYTPQVSPSKVTKVDRDESFLTDQPQRRRTHDFNNLTSVTQSETSMLRIKDTTDDPSKSASDVGAFGVSTHTLPAITPARTSPTLDESPSAQQTALRRGAERSARGPVPQETEARPKEPVDGGEKLALSHALKLRKEPSNIDGANDLSARTDQIARTDEEVTEQVIGSHHDLHVSNPVPRTPIKKDKKKGKSKAAIAQPKAADMEGAGSRSSENVRPSSNEEQRHVEKPPLEKAAFPCNNDTSKRHELEFETKAIAERARLDVDVSQSEPQRSLESTPFDGGRRPCTPTKQKAADSSKIPVRDPVNTENPSTEPPHPGKSLSGELRPKGSEKRDSATYSQIEPPTAPQPPQETKTSKNVTVSPEGVEEPSPVAMIRDASTSTHEEEDKASTAPTSYMQTERSNSIVGGLSSTTTYPPQSPSKQGARDALLDADKLHSLLQADVDTSIGAGMSQELVGSKGTYSPEALMNEKSVSSVDPAPLGNTTPGKIAEGRYAVLSLLEDKDDNVKPAASDISAKTSANRGSARSAISAPSPASTESVREKSPEKEQKPVIPSRSSSLQPVSAPIQTRHKKKPKRFEQVEEGNGDVDAKVPLVGGRVDDEVLVGQIPRNNHVHLSAQVPKTSVTDKLTRFPFKGGEAEMTPNQHVPTIPADQVKSAKPKQGSKTKKKKSKKTPSLSIERPPRTPSPDKTKRLPEPETPFKLEGGFSISAPRIPKPALNRSIQEDLTTPTQDTAPPSAFGQQEEEIRRLVSISSDAKSNSFDHGKASSPEPSQPSARRRSLFHPQVDIETSLEEAGYRPSLEPSSSRHFFVTDPNLSRLEDMIDREKVERKEKYEYTFLPFKYGKEDSNTVGGLSNQHGRKATQEETAASQLLQLRHSPESAISQSRKPITMGDAPHMSSLETRITHIASVMIMAKAERGEREVTGSVEDQKIRTAKQLLDASPRCKPSRMSPKHWVQRATQYIEENTAGQSSPPSTPTQSSRSRATRHTNTSPTTPLTPPHGHRIGMSSTVGLPRFDPRRTTGSPNQLTAVTPPSPQTFGRRTPSPVPLRISSSHLFDNKATTSAICADDAGGTSKPDPSNEKGSGKLDTLYPSNSQHGPVEEHTIGYWGQNSGATDFQIPKALSNKEADDAGTSKTLKGGNKVNAGRARFYSFPYKAPEVRDTQHRKTSDESPIKESKGGPSANAQSAKDLDDLDTGLGEALEKEESVKGKIRSSQPSDLLPKEAWSSTGANVSSEQSRQPVDQTADGASHSEDLTVKPRQDLALEESETPAPSITSQGEDPNYPYLSRRGSHSTTGGEDRSRPRGGYAAAAKTQVIQNEEVQERRRGSEGVAKDDWVAPFKDVWGRGKGKGKKK